MTKIILYTYDENWAYSGYKSFDSLDSILVRSYEEIQTIDGEEIIISIPLKAPILPKGYTDIKPEGYLVKGISPIFADDEWIEDIEAIEDYKSALTMPVNRLTLEQLDDAVTYLLANNLIGIE